MADGDRFLLQPQRLDGHQGVVAHEKGADTPEAPAERIAKPWVSMPPQQWISDSRGQHARARLSQPYPAPNTIMRVRAAPRHVRYIHAGGSIQARIATPMDVTPQPYGER